ncbi:alpha/beta fold hydrolase [Paenibacillus cremeus]|uniref:Alpha/beta hydrolase n=1 Tax=Paenibacillus cremeus TaxID=2163881 RepID=A0A559K5S3_9BACL|nr:alpha/beta hydrolase [Paenibacillus cremeus]TVY07498.1 alpha/beta hydrolase [Paenibacillus cremeus]
MLLAQINGCTIHYDVAGKGTPIIFVHPPLLTSENFYYQKKQLSDRFQTITFDIRGHGLSSPSKEPLTYQRIVQDMVLILEELHIKEAHVCGYSAGGTIALEALLAFPERFVSGIIVSGMSEMTDWLNRTRVMVAMMFSSLNLKSILSASVSGTNGDNMVTRHKLHIAAVKGDIKNIYQYYACCLKYSCTKRLKEIKAPVLILYGEKDTRPFHNYAEILHANLIHSTLHKIEGTGHQIPTKASLVMNELLRLWVESIENIDNEWQNEHNKRSVPENVEEQFVYDTNDLYERKEE